ncbi:MAG: T9SS type A sorting domain-containing protein [Candidatus Symbiothrix sp.]|nr:T9SS type A sorting domain-containing protein [Candidatus Symbiothrix sp.]
MPQTKAAVVFPNPPSDGIFRVAGIEMNTQASVSDINGKIILKKTLNPQNNTLDLSANVAGIYFLQLKTKDKIFTAKLIRK